MATTLEDMRALVDAQKQAVVEAREASRVQADRDKEAAYLAACEKLGRFLPSSVLDGRWTVEPTTSKMTSWRNGELALRSSFLPEGMRPLLLLGNWFYSDGGRGPEVLQLERQGTSHSVFIRQAMSAEQVMALLAPLVVQYVEDIESQRAVREADERRDVAARARQARIDGKLAEMESAYANAIKLDLDRIEAAWGWPDERSLTVYQLEWVEGVDVEGNVSKDRTWVVSADPDPAGFYDVFMRAGPVKRRIVSPTMVTTQHVWRSLADVPLALTETVRRDRCLRVYEWTSDGKLDWIGQRQIGDSRRVPGPALRTLLGYAVTEIPADTLPPAVSSGMPLVPVLMTADGFEPVEPEAADDPEELPY